MPQEKASWNQGKSACIFLGEVLGLSYPDIGFKLGKETIRPPFMPFTKLSEEINRNQDLNQKIIAIKDLIYKEGYITVHKIVYKLVEKLFISGYKTVDKN